MIRASNHPDDSNGLASFLGNVRANIASRGRINLKKEHEYEKGIADGPKRRE